MSARELDALAGLQQGHTRIIESKDPGRVAARTLLQISIVFGVSLDWIYTGIGAKPINDQVLQAVQKARSRRTGRPTGTG